MRPVAIILTALAATAVGYFLMPGPKAWPRGAWDAADHNRDGRLTRNEMVKFGDQAAHRNSARLLWHFDRADTNGDQVVDISKVDAYGTAIGSKDPSDHLPPPRT